ncbi:MAG: hypothetical protein HC789_13145 [Microcoleus sp. CSU_2_2]|nr:hypothetical protein [Microcoleus sp. CSU_2_2]
MRRYEQLSLLLGDLIATHHTNYNGDGKPGFGIKGQRQSIDERRTLYQFSQMMQRS